MARPQLAIAERDVLLLAQAFCTTEEMGLILGCSKDTLERRFAAAIERGRADARASLRRKQVSLALRGNVTMLIWLGKQQLGQKERYDHTSDDAPMGAIWLPPLDRPAPPPRPAKRRR